MLAIQRARSFEPGQIFGERLVVGIARVGLDGSDNRRRADEAGDVVHVAVGIVAGDAAIEPEHLIDAEIIVKDLLQLLAADAGIALLHLAEQALFRGEQDARAVGVDGAAFEHEPMCSRRSPARTAGCHAGGRAAPPRGPGTWSSSCQLGYLAQRIEKPVGEAYPAFCVAHKDRPGVARPTAIGRPA